MARASHFSLSRAPGKNRSRRAFANLQSGPGHDPGHSAEAYLSRGDGTKAPPRKVLFDWPHRARPSQQTESDLHRDSSAVARGRPFDLLVTRSQLVSSFGVPA